jgi:integrase
VGSIYQRKNIYYVDYRLGGRRVRRRIGPSKRLAELAMKDIEVKLAKNELGFPVEDDDRSIEGFFSEYMEHCQANNSPATTQRYKAIVDNFLAYLTKAKPEITRLSQLIPKVFDDYKVYRKKQLIMPNGQEVDPSDPSEYAKRGAKANTINMELGTLRTIFNQGIKWGYLKKNPTEGIEMLKVTDAKPPRFLTPEESKKLLDNCGSQLYPVFFTFLNTGMRLSELLNLEWSDIDFQRRKIKIQRKSFWSPKTGEREIPINAGMYELLQRLKREKGPNTDFVFPTGNGRGYRKSLRLELMRVAKECGILNLTKIHSLRHTFASQLVMKGVDLPTVQKLMGHSDIETTMIYSHLTPDHLVDAVNKLDF